MRFAKNLIMIKQTKPFQINEIKSEQHNLTMSQSFKIISNGKLKIRIG